MTRRYHRLSKRHLGFALLCLIGLVMTLATLAYAFAAERPDMFFASLAGAATCAFTGYMEALEFTRCRRAARNWDAYDRRDLPPI